MYPLTSTSVITRKCKRFNRVLNRSKVADLIIQGEVFACKQIAGTSEWSQHSWGNAVDLMVKLPGRPPVAVLHDLRIIAENAVTQGTKRTIANRGIRCAIERVIYDEKEWKRGSGWFPYTGEPHTSHVHVDFSPNFTGTPPCAR
jgi:hypothetical protein